MIQDFQSLEDVKFELGTRAGGGGVTTVVGPSSTGKSAIVRAIRLLYENSSFPAVRAGASRAVIAAMAGDGSEVEVSRGPSHSVYRVTDNEGIEEKFPKAGRSVPDEVAARLGLAEGVHFASQFDPPYLLADTGSRVSQVIGAFTHAEEMQSAAREGNRRRLKASSEKQIRVQDMKDVAARIKELDPASLKERRAELEATKEVLARAESLGDTLKFLTGSVAALEKLDQAEQNFKQAAAREVPESLVDRAASLWSALSSLGELVTAERRVTAAAEALSDAEEALGSAQEALKAVEAEIEICPTCGRPM